MLKAEMTVFSSSPLEDIQGVKETTSSGYTDQSSRQNAVLIHPHRTTYKEDPILELVTRESDLGVTC